MPSRAYRPRHRPPYPPSDHLNAHNYEVGLAVLGIFASAGVVTTVVSPAFSASPTISAVHPFVAIGIALAAAVGGLYVVAGVLDDHDDLIRGWRWERTGLILSGTAWVLWGVAVAATYPSSSLTWAVALGIGAMHLHRAWITVGDERATREAVRSVEEDLS